MERSDDNLQGTGRVRRLDELAREAQPARDLWPTIAAAIEAQAEASARTSSDDALAAALDDMGSLCSRGGNPGRRDLDAARRASA